jgi:hypothetical protein
MNAVQWIVGWGAVAALAGVVGGTTALLKNRDISNWMAWCFLFPPLVFVLVCLPARSAPPPKRPSLDEEDRQTD